MTDPVDGATGNQLSQNRQVRGNRHPFGYLLHGILLHLVSGGQRGGGELRIAQGCEGLLGACHKNRGRGKEERHGGQSPYGYAACQGAEAAGFGVGLGFLGGGAIGYSRSRAYRNCGGNHAVAYTHDGIQQGEEDDGHEHERVVPGACPVGFHGGEQTPGEGRQGNCRERRNHPEDSSGNEQQSEGCQLGVVTEHLQR